MNSKYKKHLLLASLATLLPVPLGALFLLRVPSDVLNHFRQLILLPLVMVPVLLLCVWLTLRDPGNKGRNQKPLTLVLWIIPVITNLCCGILLALIQGYEFSPTAMVQIFLGLMFTAIGNYLPKIKMNRTLGIKIPWAYTSEENWNATHRFGGRLWFLGGIAICLLTFLPEVWAISILLGILLVIILLPMGYSYRYYRMQKARGDVLTPMIPAFSSKKARGISLALLTVFLICIAALLFTGEIDYQFREDSLLVKADFYTDAVLRYEDFDSVQMRIGNMDGIRVGGLGSFRLLMGYFQNEEFGAYLRYTYRDPGCSIVLFRTDGHLYVLSGKDIEETTLLYNTLREKIGN